MMILTLKFRLRDTCRKELNRQAVAVNTVWNFCNDTQRQAVGKCRPWLTGFDLSNLTAGACRELGLNAQSIQKVCQQYVISRTINKKPFLKWRHRKSLGWVPFNTGVIFDGKSFIFRHRYYKPMHDHPFLIKGMKCGAGSFNCDSRGRWYINITVKINESEARDVCPVGIDLGLKTLATLSDGGVVETPSFYRKSEKKLATAQRAKKTKRVKAIHAKVRNRRKDYLHKASTKIAKKYGTIVVGDVSPSKLAKTNMAKSVLDAGWADFKRMLSYKAIMHGGTYLEVSEAYSSQTCSECGSLPASRPRGIAGLSKREWRCDDCGTLHDRDVNGARNILRVGLDTLAAGAA